MPYLPKVYHVSFRCAGILVINEIIIKRLTEFKDMIMHHRQNKEINNVFSEHVWALVDLCWFIYKWLEASYFDWSVYLVVTCCCFFFIQCCHTKKVVSIKNVCNKMIFFWTFEYKNPIKHIKNGRIRNN